MCIIKKTVFEPIFANVVFGILTGGEKITSGESLSESLVQLRGR